jgi:hypothetical protein
MDSVDNRATSEETLNSPRRLCYPSNMIGRDWWNQESLRAERREHATLTARRSAKPHQEHWLTQAAGRKPKPAGPVPDMPKAELLRLALEVEAGWRD